jgi:hypothetical protein
MGLVRTGARSMAMTWGLALVLALAVFFAGCDSQPDPTVATSGGKKAVRNTSSTDADDPDMVTAFSNTRGQAGLVDLKFKLTKRPAVGEPVDVELALIPAMELEHLFARFQAAEGLQIVSGGETEHFEHPAMGVPVKHKMTVTAKSDGIFYVTAIVLADSDKESIARNYSFPLIAGQGLAEVPSVPPAASSVAAPKSAASPP